MDVQKSKEKEILESGVKEFSPVVGEYLTREDSILDFSKSLYKYATDEVQITRQKKICQAIESIASRIFSQPVKVETPLATNIVDHHAILNHPILLATNIVGNAFRINESRVKSDRPIIVLTSSIVPPNNFFNRKGFQFHGKRVPLFSNKEMHQASCFIGAHDFHFVARLKALELWGSFSASEKEFLSSIEQEIVGQLTPQTTNYNDQISLINTLLWKKLFAQSIRSEIPDVIYVTQEHLLKELAHEVLSDDNFVSRAIFEPEIRSQVLNEFRGIAGCWDEVKDKGTHFFWFRNEKNEADRLFIFDNQLVSLDGNKKIALNREALIPLLQSGEIIPSLFVIFGFLCFWGGIRPLVGHGSSYYLTQMKQAWQKILINFDNKEAERIGTIDTKGLVGGAIATFARNSQGDLESQYAFDVIASGGMTRSYLDHLLSMPYHALLQPALLDIYESYVPVEKRAKFSLTPADLMGNAFDWIR